MRPMTKAVVGRRPPFSGNNFLNILTGGIISRALSPSKALISKASPSGERLFSYFSQFIPPPRSKRFATRYFTTLATPGVSSLFKLINEWFPTQSQKSRSKREGTVTTLDQRAHRTPGWTRPGTQPHNHADRRGGTAGGGAGACARERHGRPRPNAGRPVRDAA